MRLLIITLLLFVSSLAQASGKESELLSRLPGTILDFQKGKITVFPDPRMGAAVEYQGKAGTTTEMNVILFDNGKGPIADGAQSPILGMATMQALSEVRAIERKGLYRNVRQTGRGLWILEGRKAVTFTKMTYQIMVPGEGGVPVNSSLLMVGVAGHMLKIRVTTAATDALSDDYLQSVAAQVVRSLAEGGQ